jgi:PAS domain S-box-containing protein
MIGEDGTLPELEPEAAATIYPLISSGGNERVLKRWLEDHDSYMIADEEKPLTAAEFDLCIVDQKGIRRHKDELEILKSDAQPALLPVLLLVPENREEIIQTDRGEIADNVLTTTVDEIVSLPIRQIELEWRIQALLRLRNQSLELQSKRDKLRRFKQAVEASGHAIFITDPEGTLEYVNPAFEEITGYDRTEVIGRTPAFLQSGEMAADYYERLWETISSGEIWEAEIVDRRKDGELYTAYQTIAPITDDEGAISAYVAVQTDITERKELRDRLEQHRDIVERIEDPIMIQDRAGSFELVNEALVRFAGRSKEELLGEDEFLFMDEGAATRIEEKKTEVVETESTVRYSISPEFQNSNEEAVFSTVRYPYYLGEDLAGTIAICRDVTDLEERTRQLRVMDNILRHNLRNDLTVIRGLADHVSTQADGEIAETAEEIVAHTETLMATGEKSRAITDLLSQDPARRSIDIAASMRSIVEEITASRPDVQIETKVPDRLVVSTTLKLREAIEELITNAITHSDRETPSIELRAKAVNGDAEISIIDDGPGIPEMDRDVLETGQAIDDLYHGSGLGLWLVYWIVKRSGGSVEVTDVQPRGTNVTITLPLETAERA